MTAREQEAQALRISAARLLDIAEQLEQPRTVVTTKINTCTCDRCGHQITGLRWIGEMCDVLGLEEYGNRAPCTGTYRLDPEPDEVLATWCDECDGTGKFFSTYGELETCINELGDCPACKGTGKQSHGITLTALAASQAAQDAAAEWLMDQDLEELSDRSDDGLGIAETFTERRG